MQHEPAWLQVQHTGGGDSNTGAFSLTTSRFRFFDMTMCGEKASRSSWETCSLSHSLWIRSL